MRKTVAKLFGGVDLTWPKVIVAAIVAGIVTAVFATVPALQRTSFHAIAETFELWVLFGLIIVMNSKSNLDSALKCFVFFLISQPLAYLVQVPFSPLGWGLFGFYPYWFVWTVLCLPMGFVGYYMKRGKWWGYLILLPLIALTAYSYLNYLQEFQFCMPRFALICLFCACAAILYPVAIFDDKRIRTVGAAVGAVAVVAITAVCLLNPPAYSSEILSSDEGRAFDDTYEVSLADESYGSVRIVYVEEVEDYMVHADFVKAGETVLSLKAPSGEITEYDLSIDRDTYEVTKR